MNCKWVSRKDKNLKCNRHADSSGYCLFHKQNKSKREIALFDAYIKKGQISNFTGFYFEIFQAHRKYRSKIDTGPLHPD